MYLSEEFIHHIELAIQQTVGLYSKIEYAVPVSGGDINRCYQLKTKDRYFFLKVNDAEVLPNLFIHEKAGLQLLASAGKGNDPNPVCVPKCYSVGQFGRDEYLLMEWIVQGEQSDRAMQLLGKVMATVHQKQDKQFGLEYDNYFGSSLQSNKRHDSWSSFFIEERLEPQVKMAYDNGLLDQFDKQDFSMLYYKLDTIYPKEKPSLVHGDFWGGNYLVDEHETPYLIDPAVYYGHREVDLAITKLFGGFTEVFYEAYRSHYPLEADWEKRVGLWNLYPLLFHLNTFGVSYRGRVRTCLNMYI